MIMTSLVQRARRPSSMALLAALGAGVGLAALFWTTGLIRGEFVAAWQEQIAEGRSGPGVGLAMGIALLIGASTVVLPCGFPSVFAIPSILERETSTPGRLRALGALAAGAVRPFRLVVAVDAQSGQAMSVPSPFWG